jgi:hypothetical protein
VDLGPFYRGTVLSGRLSRLWPPHWRSRGTPAAQIVDTSAGQVLLMPAELGSYAGSRWSRSRRTTRRGLPRINGVYVLFDGSTLVPLAQLDAPALTAVRTAAVSALAVSRWRRRPPPGWWCSGRGRRRTPTSRRSPPSGR